MNIALFKAKRFLEKNSSTILTCIGAVGVVATTVLAVKATPKAIKLIENAKKEKGEELTKLEIVKVAGPSYIPSAVTGIATLACIFGANVLNIKQQASLMSAYALIDNSYKQYKNKVTEIFGEDGELRVKNEIAKDRYKDLDIVPLNTNKQLYFDFRSLRYFETSFDKLNHAENKCNELLSNRGYVMLNDFYDILGLPLVDDGWNVGWTLCECHKIEFVHQNCLVGIDDDLECCIISFDVEPVDFI